LLAEEVKPSGPDDALASRGEVAVSHREFDARMSLIPEQDRAPFLRDASRLERVLSEMLLQKQLARDATAAGFPDDELIRTRMELAATTELARAWLDHYVDKDGDADYEALAREQYLLDPSQYRSQPTIDVSHILISTKERDASEALALAEDLAERLAADPKAWEGLVMSHSEDPSAASNGGAFSKVKKGDMVKAFETAAFSLEVGKISSPVQTQYGYHIIRLDAKYESEQLDFERVKTKLIERQRKAHKERIRLDYLNELGTVETDMSEASLRKMLLRYVNDSVLVPRPEIDSE
jgi:peptidyl-prolyl cis-trans isomerase C